MSWCPSLKLLDLRFNQKLGRKSLADRVQAAVGPSVLVRTTVCWDGKVGLASTWIYLAEKRPAKLLTGAVIHSQTLCFWRQAAPEGAFEGESSAHRDARLLRSQLEPWGAVHPNSALASSIVLALACAERSKPNVVDLVLSSVLINAVGWNFAGTTVLRRRLVSDFGQPPSSVDPEHVSRAEVMQKLLQCYAQEKLCHRCCVASQGNESGATSGNESTGSAFAQQHSLPGPVDKQQDFNSCLDARPRVHVRGAPVDETICQQLLNEVRFCHGS